MISLNENPKRILREESMKLSSLLIFIIMSVVLFPHLLLLLLEEIILFFLPQEWVSSQEETILKIIISCVERSDSRRQFSWDFFFFKSVSFSRILFVYFSLCLDSLHDCLCEDFLNLQCNSRVKVCVCLFLEDKESHLFSLSYSIPFPVSLVTLESLLEKKHHSSWFLETSLDSFSCEFVSWLIFSGERQRNTFSLQKYLSNRERGIHHWH